jgi:hypothetical protein
MTLRRTLGIWALLAVAMSANGVLREEVLTRVLGRRGADVASAGSGIAIILGLTKLLVAPAAAGRRLTARQVAALWLLLTFAFEFVFGHWVDHKPWSELFGNYAIWRGRLWPFVLTSVVAAPFLWMRSPRLVRSEDPGSSP